MQYNILLCNGTFRGRRMNQQLREIILGVQHLFNGFDSLVKKPLDSSILEDKPPIFLVGAPRVGSTLVFQVMLGQMRLAYISNIMALFPSVMVKMCKLSKRVACGYSGNIRESEYGYVPGLFSPNEAGKIVRKWFDKAESEQKREYVRRTFCLISSITGCPIFMKNPTNSIRIREIRSILPESQFILLQRDPLMTAQSILLSRRRVLGRDDGWFSVKPPGYESVLVKHPFYQVLWQVLTLEKLVLTSFVDDPDVLFKMKYEEFCENPRVILRKIRERFQLDWRDDAPPLNQSMPVSSQIRLASDEWQKLGCIYHEVKASEQEIS